MFSTFFNDIIHDTILQLIMSPCICLSSPTVNYMNKGFRLYLFRVFAFSDDNPFFNVNTGKG